MKTKWYWSLETEAQRIVHTAYQIATGFYQQHTFLVLPEQYQKRNKQIVIFPDIELCSIPYFWKKVLTANITRWPVCQDTDLIKKIVKKLQAVGLKKPDLNHLKTNWENIQEKMIKQFEMIDGKKYHVNKLFIYPSYYGTSVSFSAINKTSIELFLRFDQDIVSLVEGFVSACLRDKLIMEYNASWRERELLVDYLVYSSSLTNLLRKYEPKSKVIATTTLIQKKEYSRLSKISRKFLQHIGVPLRKKRNFASKVFSLYLGNNKLSNLSWKERRFLLLLNKSRGNVVNVEEITPILFKGENHFSMYAIAKFISRLRERLEENGVPGNVIETVRKQGYVLK